MNEHTEFQRFARILSRYRGGALRLGTDFAELPPGRSQPGWLEGDLGGECVVLGEQGAREWTSSGRLSGRWAAHLWDAMPGVSERSLRAAGFERRWSNSILEARVSGIEVNPARGETAPANSPPTFVTAVSNSKEYSALAGALGADNVPVQTSQVRILQLNAGANGAGACANGAREAGASASGAGPIGAASITFDEDVAYLADLYVLPEYRGRGHGRALIDAAFEHAARKGCSRVWALPTEKARPLYERAGFRPAALLSTYLKLEH